MVVYHPTTKVLAVLELLQTHDAISGPEIARRLEVGERSVRRYILTLQDLGIPVEAERGRYGAYRLRPGYKLPPLMFGPDEALALTLGLRLVRDTGLIGAAPDAESALAKVERVLPTALRDRVRAVLEVLTMDVVGRDIHTAGRTVLLLSEAAYRGQRVVLQYRAYGGDVTEREADPYGVALREGRWYMAGYCHLRQGIRVFRVDRIEDAALVDATFERPADFPMLEHVERALATAPIGATIEVRLGMTLDEASAVIPPVTGTLEALDDGVLLRCQAYDVTRLDQFALILVGLGCPVAVLRPPELQDALERLAAHVAAIVAHPA